MFKATVPANVRMPSKDASIEGNRRHIDSHPVKQVPHVPKGLLSHSGSLKIARVYHDKMSCINILVNT